MSTETPSAPDTFLARRFNFLGLPSERRGGTLSYSALRTELGDDNAAALVTKIGVLVQVHQLDKLGIPMQNAVDRILQSLTPDERRTMAQGGAVPPRVEAILNSEAETARLQQKQSGPNANGANADIKGQHAGVGPFGRVGNMAMAAADGAGDGATARSGSSRSSASDLGSIKPENYASSHFASVGLSYAHFNELRSQGFGEQQIIAAVNTNKQLGLDANSNPAATARLQRDTPWAVDSLKGTANSLQQAKKHEDQAKDCEKHGDMAGARRHLQQAEKDRQADQERHLRTQERMRKEKPERLDDYMNKHEEIEQRYREGVLDLSATQKAGPKEAKGSSNETSAEKAALARNTSIIDHYIRNPEDAKARRDYAELRNTSGKDRSKAAAVAKVDKSIEQDAKLKAEVVERNEVKVASNETKTTANASVDKGNDDLAAALSSKPDVAVKKAEAPEPDKSKTSEPAKAAAKEAPKAQDKSDKVKMATAKPAGPKMA